MSDDEFDRLRTERRERAERDIALIYLFGIFGLLAVGIILFVTILRLP